MPVVVEFLWERLRKPLRNMRKSTLPTVARMSKQGVLDPMTCV